MSHVLLAVETGNTVVNLVTALAVATLPGTVGAGSRRIVEHAGLDAEMWTPCELRHSFVSLLSSTGMSIEDISHLGTPAAASPSRCTAKTCDRSLPAVQARWTRYSRTSSSRGRS